MSYSGVIFDLDGVICSTDQYHFEAWRQLAERLGISFTQADNNVLRGRSRMESLEWLLKKGSISCTYEGKLALAEEKNAIYREKIRGLTHQDLLPQVRPTLDLLRKKGLKLAIGSSSRNARMILNRIGMQDYFDIVVDGMCISRSKPDPEIFLKAAQLLSLSPADCLVVEDAPAGVEAARRGGFDCAYLGQEMVEGAKQLKRFCELTDLC